MVIKALSIAGFDSSGGAGIQADLKTFSALGCYGMTVLTALPIQNTTGVTHCYPIPISAIKDQLESIFNDIIPDVIKIGMLFNQDIINLVAQFLSIYAKGIPIVVDPVMAAKNGEPLLIPEAIETLKTLLFNQATIITPNINEVELITGIHITNQQDMLHAGKVIIDLNANSVLVKGGHYNSDICSDLLLTAEEHHWFSSERIHTKNTHGTGCTLSSAIAAGLAHGLTIKQSCIQAKEYIDNAIISFKDEQIGKGNGPVNHFYKLWATSPSQY